MAPLRAYDAVSKMSCMCAILQLLFSRIKCLDFRSLTAGGKKGVGPRAMRLVRTLPLDRKHLAPQIENIFQKGKKNFTPRSFPLFSTADFPYR